MDTLEKLALKVRELDAETLRELEEVEGRVVDEDGQKKFTLADAIRSGSRVTSQLRNGWYNETEACALSAALIAVKARQ